MRAERVTIEEHTERRILDSSMREAFRQTRDSSPRQLPTDHDYAVSTREYQSDQPSQKLLDWLLALPSPHPGSMTDSERQLVTGVFSFSGKEGAKRKIKPNLVI